MAFEGHLKHSMGQLEIADQVEGLEWVREWAQGERGDGLEWAREWAEQGEHGEGDGWDVTGEGR